MSIKVLYLPEYFYTSRKQIFGYDREEQACVVRTKTASLVTFQRLGFDGARHFTRLRFSAVVLSSYTILVLLARHYLLVREFRFLETTTTRRIIIRSEVLSRSVVGLRLYLQHKQYMRSNCD